MILHT